MNAIQLAELARLWRPTPTYLQAHGPVTADKERARDAVNVRALDRRRRSDAANDA